MMRNIDALVNREFDVIIVSIFYGLGFLFLLVGLLGRLVTESQHYRSIRARDRGVTMLLSAIRTPPSKRPMTVS